MDPTDEPIGLGIIERPIEESALEHDCRDYLGEFVVGAHGYAVSVPASGESSQNMKAPRSEHPSPFQEPPSPGWCQPQADDGGFEAAVAGIR